MEWKFPFIFHLFYCNGLPEGLPADGLHAVVHVVVQELPPLHHHVAQLGVQLDLRPGDQSGGDQPAVGLPGPVVQSVRVQTCRRYIFKYIRTCTKPYKSTQNIFT